MTDNKKMTASDIIKAFGICFSEHLGCEDGCPYVEVPCLGGNTLLKDAIALVKTKDTEIDILIRKNETLKDENFELKAEIERLEKEVDRLSQVVMYTDSVAEWKVYEAINEFANVLKSRHHTFKTADGIFVKCIPLDYIDNLVQGMVGESDV